MTRIRKIGLALGVTLVCLELGARVVDRVEGLSTDNFMPVDPLLSFYEPHPFLSFTLKPGSSRQAPANAKPGKRFSFHINSLGFRGKEITKAKPDGVTRILCVGGSTTYGTGATNDTLTYPARLERMLNKAAPAGRVYEVVNCGTVGYGTAENLINLELRLLDLDPDAIIVYHAANDALALQMSGFKADYSHLRAAWVQSEPNVLDSFLVRASRLYAWTTRGRNLAEQAGNLQTHVMKPSINDDFLDPGMPLDPDALPTFRRNLTNIAAVTRRAGVELYLSTFATCAAARREEDKDYVATVAEENVIIREVAAAEGLPLLDIAAPLTDKREFFDDWMHLNNKGEKQHALGVLAEIKRQHLLGF